MKDKKKPKKEILEIESAPEKIVGILTGLRKQVVEHFEKGGRVKIIYTDDSPSQELFENFTFEHWKD